MNPPLFLQEQGGHVVLCLSSHIFLWQTYSQVPCTATADFVLHAQSESAAQRPVPSAAVQAAVQSTEEDTARVSSMKAGGLALQ